MNKMCEEAGAGGIGHLEYYTRNIWVFEVFFTWSYESVLTVLKHGDNCGSAMVCLQGHLR